MTRLVDISDIVDGLKARMRDLAQQLAPAGSMRGDEWIALNPTRHDTRAGSFCINVRTGLWADFATSDRGDALDFVRYCRGTDKAEAIRWAKTWLGLEGVELARRAAGWRPPVRHRPPTDQSPPAPPAGDNRWASVAFRLWLDAKPIGETPASQYLAGRGIDLERLEQLGRMPRALRFHACLYVPDDAQLPQPERRPYPAMVAAIHVPGGKGIAAVHRTFLAPDHAGGWGKARALAKAKLTLGNWRGGSIRLWRGASGKPIEDAEPGSWVTVSEGIEDGLSVALADPSKRVICAVSVSNFANIVLPRVIAGVELAVQNDPPKPTGEPAAASIVLDKAVEKLRERGLAVRIIRPPAGVKDWNDLLNPKSGVAA